MVPNRLHLKRMLASLDATISHAVKYQLEEADFRTTLRSAVRLIKVEGSEADHDWIKGQLEEMLARHGLKDFEI